MGRASGGSNTPHWIRNKMFVHLLVVSVLWHCNGLSKQRVNSFVAIYID